jgi:hypothetical protein
MPIFFTNGLPVVPWPNGYDLALSTRGSWVRITAKAELLAAVTPNLSKKKKK